MRTAFWIAGGMSTGIGIMLTALYGFNFPGGEIAAQVSQLGADALPDVSITRMGYVALTMVFGGLYLMIKANATAWKQTGGY